MGCVVPPPPRIFFGGWGALWVRKPLTVRTWGSATVTPWGSAWGRTTKAVTFGVGLPWGGGKMVSSYEACVGQRCGSAAALWGGGCGAALWGRALTL